MKLMAYKDTHTDQRHVRNLRPFLQHGKKTTTASINKENVQVKLQR